MMLSLAVSLTACASVPRTEQTAAGGAVLSIPGDADSSIAVSWWAGSGDSELVVTGPDDEGRTVTGTRYRGFATVVIHGLAPATEYSYTTATGEIGSFRTQERDPEEMRFAIIGDLQPFNAETDRTTGLVMDKVASLQPDFAVQVGDMVEVGTSATSWRRAMRTLSGLAAERPVIPVSGNHEYYYVVPSARIFKSIFPAPYEDNEARRNTWYSTSVGPLHLVMLDTEARGADQERQLEWLEQDLAAARTGGAEWVFVVLHRSVLGTTTGPGRPDWASALFPLAARYDVDAIFWGHDHAFEHYEYTYGANGYVLAEGDHVADRPLHLFTTGTSGARVDSLYPGFFTHRPFRETLTVYPVSGGPAEERAFTQHPWDPEVRLTEGAGIRYQSTDVYPRAASYYYWPFASADDEAARRYSGDPSIRYADDSAFFGYTYGETSIHYLWVEIADGVCTISAHYADGAAGAQGTVLRTPAGTRMEWRIDRRGE